MEEKILIHSDSNVAFYSGEPVNIHGGYKSPTKGHCVEITNNNGGFHIEGKQLKRISVPFWVLEFSSHDEAEKIFRNCFGYQLTKRRCRDYRRSGEIKIAAQEN